MKHVESAPKLDLARSMAMLEDAQRLTPGRRRRHPSPLQLRRRRVPRLHHPRQGRAHLRRRRQRVHRHALRLRADHPRLRGGRDQRRRQGADGQGLLLQPGAAAAERARGATGRHHALRRTDDPREDRVGRDERRRQGDARPHRSRQDRPLRLSRLGRLVRRAPRRRAAGRVGAHEGVRVRRHRRPRARLRREPRRDRRR